MLFLLFFGVGVVRIVFCGKCSDTPHLLTFLELRDSSEDETAVEKKRTLEQTSVVAVEVQEDGE